ncbi:anaphase-promoting complex subunit 5-domain-containing protein [Annulohypoxylon maeteangense]|uniref:anaphase-promoting complex subunit 5-domain-containing protein n=1 Tax=Annulohypoxylon maeteangense TaxID=1927788 RepID=UPI002007E940|nr:anaphase-promoting complex subunit 5-domain-containing protein [Annulohypoxylon maeteangense]KAI0886234.1 anaphase-promoting complex subunit 5-domain-containing protein [Annulohypoxylon maeteangense]
MSRFLNPAKIGLLALVELYTNKAVPTASTVEVLSFITSHLIDVAPTSSNTENRWKRAETIVSLVISIADFEKVLAPHTAASGIPGRNLWYVFLDRLWKIDSLDALHEFFERCSELLAKTKDELRRDEQEGVPIPGPEVILLSRNSPFGAFVRRSQLEFTRLRFHDAFELWKDFVKYRQTTAAYYRKKTPSFQRLSFDHVLLAGENDWGPGVEDIASVAYGDMLRDDPTSTLPVSTDDIEKLLEFQIEQMQKYGNRIPIEIQHQFQDLLNDSFMVPSLSHYLSYLDAWRAGDYSTSFDYLHRYFDYTMQNRDRSFYQYALMNLAVLQADFGCYKEAISAMLETVSTARENRDMTCLNFALNWLFHFGRAHPEVTKKLESNSMLGTGKESLAFLRSRAKETGMWSLCSSALMSEAKMSLSNGESVATAIEHLVRSSQILVERNMKNMIGSQLSINIALWDRLGVAYLSITTCEIFLRCHARHSIFDDELKVTSRQASILTLRGKYDEALGILEGMDANSLRAWKPSQYWHKFRGIIKLRRDLHRNNLDGAELLISQLLQSKNEDLEPDLAFVVDSLHVECLVRRGILDQAFVKVEKMISELRDENKDIALRIRLLLLKAELLDKCGRPQKGFTIAVRAANVAWRARLIPYLWPAIGAIANILTSLGEFEPAIQLLNAILPRSLECENSAMTAKLYSHLGDANMGMAGKMPPKSNKRREFMTKAVEAIEKAFNHYSSVEDINKQCEMMAKKATIMKVTGDNVLANDYAAAYLSIRRDAERMKI